MSTPLSTDKSTHVWVFDENYRVYPKKEPGQPSGGPIYREHWVKREITGETSRSWLISEGWRTVKFPKRGASPRLWATLNGMAGPLPPLPERLAKREQLEGDPEDCC
jgi:hypothetical protein